MSTGRSVRLDAAKLHALAHPLRSRLLASLRAHGPATATTLAQRLGTNSGATSYHLRQLAEVGLIEEDEAQGRGRERVWRSAHDVTSWSDSDFSEDPSDRAASDWLYGHHVRTTSRFVEDWLESRQEWSTPWRNAADSRDYNLTLTAEQLRALTEELHAVIGRHRDAAEEVEPAPTDAERVVLILHAFPQPEPRI